MTDAIIVLQLALLSGVLALVTVADLRTQTIPDGATALLAAGGFAAATTISLSASVWALTSSVAYFLIFWGIRQAHWRLTGRIGLGFGDVKLAGAAGIWLTPTLLPVFMGVASASALVSVGAVAAFTSPDMLSRRIPFGPFLTFGLLVCWLLKVSNPAWEIIL